MLTEADRELIAEAYEVTHRQVTRDAAFVLGWSGTNDDLLVFLGAERDWPLERVVRYLGTLRRVLRRTGSPATQPRPSLGCRCPARAPGSADRW